MAIKKKKQMDMMDQIARWMFGISTLLMLASLVPVLPWRRAEATTVFHSRFPMYRQMSLVSMTDKNTAFQPLTKWKREMCMLMKTYTTPDLATAVATAGARVYSQKTGFSPATAMGCRSWEACKASVTARCLGYTRLTYVGFLVMAMLLISAGCSMAVPCKLACDLAIKASGKKAKEKKQAAMRATMHCGCIGLGFSLAGLAIYHNQCDGVFKGFKEGGYYPYPAAYIGYWVCGAAIGVQAIGCFPLINRVYHIYGTPKEEVVGDVDDESS